MERITATAFALNADTLDGVDSLALQKRVAGECAAGSSIRVIATDGSVICENDDDSGARNSLDAADGVPINAVFVDKDGRVGIGEKAPIATLHIKNGDSGVAPNINFDDLIVETAGNTGVVIGSGTTYEGALWFGNNVGYFRGGIRYFHNSDALAFNVASAEKVRINNAGDVGIGTQTPGSKLDMSTALLLPLPLWETAPV